MTHFKYRTSTVHFVWKHGLKQTIYFVTKFSAKDEDKSSEFIGIESRDITLSNSKSDNM